MAIIINIKHHNSSRGKFLGLPIRNKYILLDVLICSIAEYFYELCCILTSPQGESKYKQRVKILSDTTRQNV